MRLFDFQTLYKFNAGHVGHNDIAENEIQRTAVGAQKIQCRPSVGRFQYAVSCLFQNHSGDTAHGRFVVDHQDHTLLRNR